MHLSVSLLVFLDYLIDSILFILSLLLFVNFFCFSLLVNIFWFFGRLHQFVSFSFLMYLFQSISLGLFVVFFDLCLLIWVYQSMCFSISLFQLYFFITVYAFGFFHYDEIVKARDG